MKLSRFVPKILTSSNNGNFLEIYTPSGNTNADIIDFFVTITLPSIEAIPQVLKPEGIELMSESEQDKAWQEATKDAPKKILKISYQTGNEIIKATEFVIMRANPSYTENLIPYLTANNTLHIPNGCKILATVTDFGSGLLGSGDSLEFRLIGKEEYQPDIEFLADKYLGTS